MSIQDVSAEQLAKLFHHYHQALGPDFGCRRDAAAEPWEQLPAQEKSRLVTAARLAILDLSSLAGECQDSRRYYAKPGEAEWGA